MAKQIQIQKQVKRQPATPEDHRTPSGKVMGY